MKRGGKTDTDKLVSYIKAAVSQTMADQADNIPVSKMTEYQINLNHAQVSFKADLQELYDKLNKVFGEQINISPNTADVIFVFSNPTLALKAAQNNDPSLLEAALSGTALG